MRNDRLAALRKGLTGWAERSFDRALEQNVDNVVRLLDGTPPNAALLDLGCDDGSLTVRLAEAVDARTVHGVELVDERARLAAGRGIDVHRGDLNASLPYDDETFDVVCSHQVIEHLSDTDTFVREIFRVLKPGGCSITSTENLAGWHNIGALLFGWQPFSLGNVSDTALGLGNPLAVHRGEQDVRSSWQHLRVFAHRGLRELFTAHGFDVEAVVGAGYYPLPRFVARLDSRHAAFLTVTARRPASPTRRRARSAPPGAPSGKS